MTSPLPVIAFVDGPLVWLILVVVVLLFGGSKLPELARGLGKARREFRKASEEVDDEIRSAIEEDERKRARAKIVEEEERAKIRARIKAEERARAETPKSDKPAV